MGGYDTIYNISDAQGMTDFDVVLGAHAFQHMALREVVDHPVRNDYIIEDPDIRGVRLRFGRWSCTFTTGSFTYTRTSAMKVSEDDGGFSAMHMARSYVRVAPLEIAHRTESDYGTLGRAGADYSLAIGERAAVVATSYQPALTSHTWHDDQPIGPWRMNELWLMTDRGTVGLVVARKTIGERAWSRYRRSRGRDSKTLRPQCKTTCWLFELET